MKNSDSQKLQAIEGKLKPLTVFLLLAVLTFMLYGQTLSFYLGRLDEDVLVLNHQDFLKNPGNIPAAFSKDVYLSDGGHTFYRPVQTVSYILDTQFAGKGEWIYVFTNILLHIFVCYLLFSLLILLGARRIYALAFTLLFLANPLFVQTVAWIPSRGDLLLALFGLLTFYFYIRMEATGKEYFGLLSIAAFLPAMFSKETAVAIPLSIAGYYLLVSRSKGVPLKLNLIVFGGYLLITGCYLYARSLVVLAATPEGQLGLGSLAWNIRSVPELLAKFFIPAGLSPMPGYSIWITLSGLLLAGILIYFAFRGGASQGAKTIFGLLWFVLLMAPALVYRHEMGSSAYDYLEHRAYLPSVGLVIGILFMIPYIFGEGRDFRILFSLILVFLIFSGMTLMHSRDYADPIKFYDAAVKGNPQSAVALNNRGTVWFNLRDYQRAMADFESAVSIKPDYAQAVSNKAIIYLAMNDNIHAISLFDTAIRMNPSYFEAHYFKGMALDNLERYPEALTEYDKASALYPGYAPVYKARGTVYWHLQNFDKALTDFSKAISINGNDTVAFLDRGRIRFMVHDTTGACADWKSAALLGSADARLLLNTFCK